VQQTNELITETALKTIAIEAEAIASLRASIDQDFCQVVQLIYRAKGRVVITGIGKSALIAQKIVATLNSTGTPALFMHAADAIHGDLGMIRPEDVIICISKSGHTPEIKVLVPLLKHMGQTLVAMVANRDSWLARQADYILFTPVTQEADPNNLAPTTSTTAQVVLGDALATALLALRGFTPKDFAQFHPGGTLGKQLYLRVSDLYPHNERPVVYLDTPLRDTIVEISSRRLGCTAVLDAQQHLRGIITDGDLRRMLQRFDTLNGLTAGQVMTHQPQTVAPDELAVRALNLMRQHSITQLLVAEGNKYLGVVHLHDLIREGLI